jgi:hypothetical protein
MSDAPRPFICAGCGERFATYEEANAEGKLHDHWTADYLAAENALGVGHE